MPALLVPTNDMGQDVDSVMENSSYYSFYLLQSHRLCLAHVHALQVWLEWGIVNDHIAARGYFREKEGIGCHKFSGSEQRAGTLHLAVLRRIEVEGWGVYTWVKRCGRSQAVIQ